MEVADGAREEDVELWKAALGDDTFVKLGASELSDSTHPSATSMELEPSQRHEPSATERPRNGATTTHRFKRKNFSKELQLLCLERYAQYARDFGRLPDKYETQQVLQQSYVQFLKEGGTAEEPRLTHAEFLKLIRNRRRESHARSQRPPPRNKDKPVTAKRMAGLTPAKRKLQEEHARIREFIQVIDRAREQARLIPDPQQQQRCLRPQQAMVEQAQTQQHPMTVEMVTVSPPSIITTLPPLHVPSDPMALMETILQIHLETREVQREIVARLRSISCVIRQQESHGQMEEASSVSV